MLTEVYRVVISPNVLGPIVIKCPSDNDGDKKNPHFYGPAESMKFKIFPNEETAMILDGQTIVSPPRKYNYYKSLQGLPFSSLQELVEEWSTKVFIKGVGGGNGCTHFVYEQSNASDTWVIEHNLGRKPNVVVFSNGISYIPHTEYIDDNNVTLTFWASSQPYSINGFAYLN